MPNAKDIHDSTNPKILVMGNTGSGKTTQFLTLPGKKFAYLFDPNALNTLKGYDIDYEEFLPDDLSLSLTSLSSKVRDKLPDLKKKANKGADLYRQWEKHFEDGIASGFFDQYDVISFDSFTTFSDLVMDGILAVNGRGGQWPQQDDYGPQMNTLRNIMRTATALGKTLYLTGHVELKQDDLSKRIYQTPVMTGKLKTKLPLLFSEILFLEAMSDGKGHVNYNVQTKPDRQNPLIRTTLRGTEQFEDITIDWKKDPVGQGLGGLLMKYNVIAKPQPQPQPSPRQSPAEK